MGLIDAKITTKAFMFSTALWESLGSEPQDRPLRAALSSLLDSRSAELERPIFLSLSSWAWAVASPDDAPGSEGALKWTFRGLAAFYAVGVFSTQTPQEQLSHLFSSYMGYLGGAWGGTLKGRLITAGVISGALVLGVFDQTGSCAWVANRLAFGLAARGLLGAAANFATLVTGE